LPIAGVLFVAVGGFALWHGEWVLGAATLLVGGFYLSMTRFSRLLADQLGLFLVAHVRQRSAQVERQERQGTG